MEDHDTVAELEVGDAFANGGDNAGSFVSEDARSRVGPGGNLLEIGATDAAGVHAYQNSPAPICGTGTVSSRTSLTPR